jgi:hypothetical protein
MLDSRSMWILGRRYTLLIRLLFFIFKAAFFVNFYNLNFLIEFNRYRIAGGRGKHVNASLPHPWLIY